MWTLKIKFSHENSAIIPFAKKYGLTFLAFPLNRFEKKGHVFLTVAHIILGEEARINEYIREIKADKKYLNVEHEGNMVVYTLRARKGATHLQMYLSPELIFAKPIMVKPDGFEYMEVAALEKGALTRFLKLAEKWLHIEVRNISQERIRDFYVPHIMPDITEKQKEAVMLAYRNGFYACPKRIDIAALAKKAGLSASTFQEHLRKAEQKLIPFFLENIAREG